MAWQWAYSGRWSKKDIPATTINSNLHVPLWAIWNDAVDRGHIDRLPRVKKLRELKPRPKPGVSTKWRNSWRRPHGFNRGSITAACRDISGGTPRSPFISGAPCGG